MWTQDDDDGNLLVMSKVPPWSTEASSKSPSKAKKPPWGVKSPGKVQGVPHESNELPLGEKKLPKEQRTPMESRVLSSVGSSPIFGAKSTPRK